MMRTGFEGKVCAWTVVPTAKEMSQKEMSHTAEMRVIMNDLLCRPEPTVCHGVACTSAQSNLFVARSRQRVPGKAEALGFLSVLRAIAHRASRTVDGIK